jgi:NAD(P)-dependent dehydrogenase (short-subunit alcohol dehydrogenase family)
MRTVQSSPRFPEARLGKIDILVNNAGFNIPKPALEVTEKDWDSVLDINLKGTFFCAQRVGKGMIEKKYPVRLLILCHRWHLSDILNVPHTVQVKGDQCS